MYIMPDVDANLKFEDAELYLNEFSADIMFFNIILYYCNNMLFAMELKGESFDILNHSPGEKIIDQASFTPLGRECLMNIERNLLSGVMPVRIGRHSIDALDYLIESNKTPFKIKSISYNSPLQIILEAAPWVLVLGVVISGGKIKWDGAGGFEATLPPLGKGIREIRKAFFSNRRHKKHEEAIRTKQEKAHKDQKLGDKDYA